jgi:hypothetical protein
MKRITKRSQYINGLVFDKQHFEESIKIANAEGSYLIWHLGDRLTVTAARKVIEEIDEELKKLAEEPDYKPYMLNA